MTMPGKIMPNGRAALKESLLQFFVFADALDAHPMREAIEACLTVLDAPGALDKKALAPWLKVVHERAAEVFRRGVEETTGTLRDRLRDGLRQAEEDALWMQEALEELEAGPLN